jgi:ABC-type bacteriocin/lantibiotic exporter with double-glycine peptidase domain
MRRRPVVIRQHDPNDCGAAVLASVATYWGLRIPIALVRQYALTEREGTTALGIIKAAEELGFYAKGARILPDMLPDLPLPAIVHMFMMPGRRPHFVVLYRVQRERVLIGDPPKGSVGCRWRSSWRSGAGWLSSWRRGRSSGRRTWGFRRCGMCCGCWRHTDAAWRRQRWGRCCIRS